MESSYQSLRKRIFILSIYTSFSKAKCTSWTKPAYTIMESSSQAHTLVTSAFFSKSQTNTLTCMIHIRWYRFSFFKSKQNNSLKYAKDILLNARSSQKEQRNAGKCSTATRSGPYSATWRQSSRIQVWLSKTISIYRSPSILLYRDWDI